MSKRRIAIVLSLVLLLSLCGCDMASSGNEPDIQQPKSSIGASSEGTVAETEEESSSEGKQSMDISFDFETKTVTLNSGYKMPINGIGTYSLLDEVCVESVSAALRSGVRLIDTAYMYHNEESVGEAVRTPAFREKKYSSPPSCIQVSSRIRKPPLTRLWKSWILDIST